MKDPKELIEECKSHLRDNTTHQQQYKTDIRKLITALERALSIANVVGHSEHLCQCYDSHEFGETYEKVFCSKCHGLESSTYDPDFDNCEDDDDY